MVQAHIFLPPLKSPISFRYILLIKWHPKHLTTTNCRRPLVLAVAPRSLLSRARKIIFLTSAHFHCSCAVLNGRSANSQGHIYSSILKFGTTMRRICQLRTKDDNYEEQKTTRSSSTKVSTTVCCQNVLFKWTNWWGLCLAFQLRTGFSCSLIPSPFLFPKSLFAD